MKPQEHVAVRPQQGKSPQAQPATAEWDGKVVAMGDELVELAETTEKAIVTSETGRSAARPKATLPEPNVSRERRATLVSSIPAQLAKSMMAEAGREPRPLPRPVAGPPGRVVAERQEEATGSYSVELVDDHPLPPKAQVESLIEQARRHMDHGNLGAAVIAADQALAEAGKAAVPEVAELIKAGRPLFDRIFAAYVGLLGQVPVRTRSDDQIAGQELGERTSFLLASVDGVKTLEQLSASTGIPPVEAMRIAASLLAAGIVRVQPAV